MPAVIQWLAVLQQDLRNARLAVHVSVLLWFLSWLLACLLLLLLVCLMFVHSVAVAMAAVAAVALPLALNIVVGRLLLLAADLDKSPF